MIVSPWGRVEAMLDTAPGFATAAIDRDAMTRVREAMPVLEHRRLDLLPDARRPAA
jgi:predicted amidohydrolase